MYYIQKYKIATPNIEYATVMNFLRNGSYKGYGFFLNDVDITIDYAGSFDKYKCINHLREDLKKTRKFSEIGTICLSTYLPPLNCDDFNSDNWPEIS